MDLPRDPSSTCLLRRDLLALAGAVLPAALGLEGCGGPGLEQLIAGPVAKVALARSGDSVALEGGQVVRLAGIEAPYGRDIYAAEAQMALSDLVAGQTVQLLFGGARQDSYGRTLAHLRLSKSGQWVQGAMLDQGAARVRTYADNRALALPMLDAEARARKAKRGLWTLLAYRVRLPQEVAADPFGFQVIEGRVTDLPNTPYGRALDLERWVKAEIAPAAAAQFPAAGVAPDGLKGKLVRVRGDVRRGAAGAWLTLDHPEQIERLKQPA
ncbi:MAG TPA: thermonuclease family protein [Caulobacteraceae bacterium]|nr:thermonuclease family protein [Caulobacteraceae bacterium]